MNEYDWTRVLNHLYENNGVFHTNTDTDEPDEQQAKVVQRAYLRDELLEELELEADNKNEVSNVITHLTTTELVEQKSAEGWAELTLTPKGFEVCHDREQTDRGQKINASLMFFTFTLVMVEVIAIIPVNDLARGIVIFALLLVLLFVVVWGDMLDWD
ncbi:hypothetical protein [Haloarchaeobius iranensis]|uniref:Uncharacterized protein n=1 Tax=Haloarchaeobius iranensis TaxID=996166 RepID=A0A1G9XTS3_9EURY|nr:hypothetical protein [Haloarchaeobius iranensis]SDM99881.1 hypothetical protein SAMN05192554_111122 [Haloarchaeobius iranensis]